MARAKSIDPTLFDNAWSSFIGQPPGQAPKTPAFWIQGNAFDTMLDYLALNPTAQKPDMAKIALQMARLTYDAWYDDDGWWVMAAAKAYAMADTLGWQSHKEAFLEFLTAKWSRFCLYAPRIWEICGSATGAAGIAPNYPGGVWNSGWTFGASSPQYNNIFPFWQPLTPWVPDPLSSQAKLGGFQNTVTNTLFLNCAQRLTLGDIAPAHNRRQADRERTFLFRWYYDSTAPMLNLAGATDPGTHPTKGCVVRERVSYYANGTQPAWYSADCAWAGDQGLTLGALVDFMGLILRYDPNGKFSPDYVLALSLAIDIIDGTIAYITDTSGILQPYNIAAGAPGDDQTSYATGTGVFMRYLTYAYNNNADIRTTINPTGGTGPTPYQSFVAANANYVDPVAGGDYLTSYTSQLARQIAAATIPPG